MKILIIDDEPQICKTLKGLLGDEGHRVEAHQTAKAGQDALTKNLYDILFLDIMLPDGDGIQILEEIIPIYPNLKIIMMSGHADLATAIRATKLGAHTFFEKPLNPDQILLELEHLDLQFQMQNKLLSVEENAFSNTIIGESDVMKHLIKSLSKAAPSEGRVLILGENGTGKELVARAIHEQSDRAKGPFISLNCAALPEPLVESELFGYEKGAFTGAHQQKAGRFELANNGTLFLDEVGDMGISTQAKLLRVLEENEAIRVGGSRSYCFDVRIIAATNKNLEASIVSGEFREDLFYRLNVIPIHVPPLRNRDNDIIILAKHFLKQFCLKSGKNIPEWDSRAIVALKNYAWPGNVRELRNLIERIYIMNDNETIRHNLIQELLPVSKKQKEDIPSLNESSASLRDLLADYEKTLLENGFSDTNGNVSELARRLKIDRANLHRKLKQYNIK